jgi:hypothetical protein
MKRDMDLARAILFEVEKLAYDGAPHNISISGHDDHEVAYHVLILGEAGLLETSKAVRPMGSFCAPKRLTWEGHEFLDAARDDTMWAKAKQNATKNAGTLSFEALKIALGVLIKHAIGGGQ